MKKRIILLQILIVLSSCATALIIIFGLEIELLYKSYLLVFFVFLNGIQQQMLHSLRREIQNEIEGKSKSL